MMRDTDHFPSAHYPYISSLAYNPKQFLASLNLTKGSLKKTAIIVTSSLSGGRGSVKIPIIKLIIIGTYTSGRGVPKP